MPSTLRGAGLYLSATRGIALLYKEGREFSFVSELFKPTASVLASAFLLVRPDFLLAEGIDEAEMTKIREACAEHSVKFLIASGEDASGLFADELEMIARCISQ